MQINELDFYPFNISCALYDFDHKYTPPPPTSEKRYVDGEVGPNRLHTLNKLIFGKQTGDLHVF